MKKLNILCGLAACGLILLASAGCSGKKTVANQVKTVEQSMADLRSAMATASPEVQSNFYQGVTYSLRYGKTDVAVATLQQMSGDASLKPDQKQAVDDAIKALQANAGQQNPPAQ